MEGFSQWEIVPAAVEFLSQLEGLQGVRSELSGTRHMWNTLQRKQPALHILQGSPMARYALNYPSWELVNVKGINFTFVHTQKYSYETGCNTAAVPKQTRDNQGLWLLFSRAEWTCLKRMEPRTRGEEKTKGTGKGSSWNVAQSKLPWDDFQHNHHLKDEWRAEPQLLLHSGEQ